MEIESTSAAESPFAATRNSAGGADPAQQDDGLAPIITFTLPPPPRAVALAADAETKRLYWDRSHYASPADQTRALKKSSTLYVGNLSFTTRTRHVLSHFSMLGPVKTVHMGLDRKKKTPCGFCFVVMESRADALSAVSLLSGTKLDGKIIRVELDAGFQPGREYGRGKSGGQVRTERKAAIMAAKRERSPEQEPERDEEQPTKRQRVE